MAIEPLEQVHAYLRSVLDLRSERHVTGGRVVTADRDYFLAHQHWLYESAMRLVQACLARQWLRDIETYPKKSLGEPLIRLHLTKATVSLYYDQFDPPFTVKYTDAKKVVASRWQEVINNMFNSAVDK